MVIFYMDNDLKRQDIGVSQVHSTRLQKPLKTKKKKKKKEQQKTNKQTKKNKTLHSKDPLQRLTLLHVLAYAVNKHIEICVNIIA